MITKDDFELWKVHSITKELYKRLKERQKSIDENLLDERLYSKDGLLQMKRLCGEKVMIAEILNLQPEDFIDEVEG